MRDCKCFVGHLTRSAIAIVLLLSSGYAQKQLTLTTASPEAKENFVQAINALESFQFGAFTTAAQKTVAADSNFAMGHMLMAATLGPQQRQKHLDKFAALAPNASKGEQLYLQGMTHFYKNEDDKALEAFQKLSKMLPEDRMVYMMLGNVHRRMGNLSEAIAAFEAANRIDASLPRAWSFIGDCYLLQEKYDKARTHYKQVVDKVDPDATPFGPFFGQIWAYLYKANRITRCKSSMNIWTATIATAPRRASRRCGFGITRAASIWNSAAPQKRCAATRLATNPCRPLPPPRSTAFKSWCGWAACTTAAHGRSPKSASTKKPGRLPKASRK